MHLTGWYSYIIIYCTWNLIAHSKFITFLLGLTYVFSWGGDYLGQSCLDNQISTVVAISYLLDTSHKICGSHR